MDILQRIWSSEESPLALYEFDEIGLGNLYTPLQIEMSQPIHSRLDDYDLVTLYAINTRLILLGKSLLPKLSRPKKTLYPSFMIDKIIEDVKHSKEELFDVKNITDYIDYNLLTDEIRHWARAVKKSQSSLTVTDYPALQSLFILQQVVQERIESFPLAISKAESFLESNIAYPPITDSSHDDEAIIYCLTKNKNHDRIQSFLDYYVSGKITEINSDVHNRSEKLKKLLKRKESALKDIITHLDDEVQCSAKLPNLINEANSLRLLQRNSGMLLRTALSQRKGGTMYRLPPEVIFDLSRPFSLFKSEFAILTIYKELELLLRSCHNFLKERFIGNQLVDDYLKSRLDTLGIASLFVFGCQRLRSNLINEVTYDAAIRYINEWQAHFSQRQQETKVISAAMAVAALFMASIRMSSDFKKQIKIWLLSQQHKYGCWCQDTNHKPINTTVMVLDAIELTNKEPNVTFNTSFASPIGSLNHSSQPSLYIELDIDARQLTVGARSYRFSDKVWVLMTELIACKRGKTSLPFKYEGYNWKNAVDMLRRKLKKDFDDVIVSLKKRGYYLNPNVKIKGGSQLAIRKTHYGKADSSRYNSKLNDEDGNLGTWNGEPIVRKF